ncbi:FtsB family cell division protein [Dermabacteraceae bacterium P13101]
MTSKHRGASQHARRPVAAYRAKKRSRRNAGANATAIRLREIAASMTRKSLILSAMVVLALMMVVPRVNSYVAQKQQLAAAHAELAQREKEVAELQIDVKRWDDPAYVAAQARERLLYVMPGETQYRLTDSSGKELPLTEEQRAKARAEQKPWYSLLWESLEGAGAIQQVPERNN